MIDPCNRLIDWAVDARDALMIWRASHEVALSVSSVLRTETVEAPESNELRTGT